MGDSGSHWQPLGRWTLICCAAAAFVAVSGGAVSADPSQDGAAGVIVVTAPDGTTTSTAGWITGTTGSVDVDPLTLPTLAAGSGDSTASLATDSACVRSAASIKDLTLLDGAITAETVDSQISACVSGSDVEYDTTGSSITKLKVLGTAIDTAATDPPDEPIQVADWGELTLDETAKDDAGRQVHYALHLHLTADHGDLPEGTDIYVGYAAALQTPLVSDPGGGTGGTGGGTGGGSGDGHPDPGNGGGGQGGADNGGPHSGNAGDGGGQAPAGGGKQHHHRQPPAPVEITHAPLFAAASNTTKARAAVILAAASQLGWPYIWGGESRAEGGFDCSGLVDYAYDAAGFTLPGRPTAAVLWYLAKPITRHQLRPGDLVFLGAPTGEPYHVAMFVGGGQVVVAPHRGALVELVPLADTPWDGFGTLWKDGPHGSKLVFGLKEAQRAILKAQQMTQAELQRQLEADRIARERALQVSLLRASALVVTLAPPVQSTPAIDLAAVARVGRVPAAPTLPVVRPNLQIPWIDRRSQHVPAFGAWPSNPVTMLWTFDRSMPI